MYIKYDKGSPVCPHVYLARPGEKRICLLNSIQENTASLSLNLKDFASFSFTLDQFVYDSESGRQLPANGYGRIDYHMELYIDGFGWFRINDVPSVEHDGDTETKSVTAESIESELQDFDLKGMKINYGSDDSLEMLVPGNVTEYPDGLKLPNTQITFYNPDRPELSLLNIILGDTCKWTVGHVDAVLLNAVCRFDVSSTNIYSFLMDDVASAYECLFIFDCMHFQIHAYSLNADNIMNTGLFKDTNIIVGFRGVENSIEKSSAEDIYTVYNVNGDDDLGIQYVNFGTNRLENIDHFLTTNYMPQSLIDKYKTWRDYRESRREDYISLSRQYNRQLNIVSEIENKLPDGGCQTEWNNTSDDELLASYSNYLALKTGFENLYTDENGAFDLNLIKASPDWDSYYSAITYAIPAIENEIALRQLDSSIQGGSIDYDYNKWETDWKLYGVSELEARLADYEERLAALTDSGFDKASNTDNSKYDDAYFQEMHQEYLRLAAEKDACGQALTERQSELDSATLLLTEYNDSRKAIVAEIDKTNARFGFTAEDFIILWKLYNEVDYVNDNIFTTNLDTTDSTIDIQLDLLHAAEDELYTYSQPQYEYSTTLDNLLAISDYAAFHEDFICGNFIRVMTDDTHQIRLRIISMDFNPLTMDNDLQIRFSNVITTKSGRTDRKDILNLSVSHRTNAITGSSSGQSKGIDLTQQLVAALLKSPQFQNYSQKLTNAIVGSLSVYGQIRTDELKAKLAQVDELEANSAFIKYLENSLISSDKIVAALIEGDNAQFQKLITDCIDTSELHAEVANISNILAGRAGIGELQALQLTAANVRFSDTVIKDMIAAKITVNDLKAGNLILSDKMQIESENGKLVMDGTALQIKGTDSSGNEYIGVQLGYDTTNNPSLILRNSSGAAILTPQGITENAVADKLIQNAMLDDGSVTKRNLDWTDIAEGVDADGNPIWDVSSIHINGESFGAAYTTFKENITGDMNTISNTIASVESNVDKNTKAITGKVWQTDITEKINTYDGTTAQSIRDRIAKTETNISGITSTVSDIQTDLDTKATRTELTTIAQQTNDRFKWIVKSGTSESDFTLTDRMADLTAAAISLNGNVRVSGDMLADGAITTSKLAAEAVTADKMNVKNLTVTTPDPDDASSEITTFQIDANGRVSLNVQSLTLSTIPVATSEDIDILSSQLENVNSDIENNINGHVTELQGSIDELNEDVGVLNALSAEINNSQILLNFGPLSRQVAGIEDGITGYSRYIEINNGKMIFGENTDDEGNPIEEADRTTLTLENNTLYFTQGGNTVASLSDKALNITEANVSSSLNIGNYIIQPRTSGGLAFYKK